MMNNQSYTESFKETDAAKHYENDVFRVGSRSWVIWEMEQVALLRLMGRFYPDYGKADVLDFACGAGRITTFLCAHVGSLVGIDVSEAMLEIAKSKVSDVEFVCENIAERPEAVPGEKDIITSFRFLLKAEPRLRVDCIGALREKLRGDESVMILGIHHNPWGYVVFKRIWSRLFSEGRGKPAGFSLCDMQRLAVQCGLRIVGGTGVAFIPHPIARLLPDKVYRGIEGMLSRLPWLWRFASHMIVVCKRTS